MNMLPINAEWKQRRKWADKQRKQQRSSCRSNRQVKSLKPAVGDEAIKSRAGGLEIGLH